MAVLNRRAWRQVAFVAGLGVLAGCDQPLDFDLRGLSNAFDTSSAARQATGARPAPDNRGVISYPNYQVAIAQSGDRIGDVALRVGIPAAELARYNGIPLDAVLRQNEVIALPRRVAEPSPLTGAIGIGPIQPGDTVDISALAGSAIDRVSTPIKPAGAPQTGTEPIRHKIEGGESAYSISRLYNISVRALADWNGLGRDLKVREGQYLLIPTIADTAVGQTGTSGPGQGTVTPEPPSAATALPAQESAVAAVSPQSPDLAASQSDTGQLHLPLQGSIIRAYEKGKNEGIDIAASAGSPVKAAADGTVAAITRDTDQVPIVVIRHADNLLTVYAGVDNLTVKKGDSVKRGQTFASVRAGDPSFLHFEVRQGLESVDPTQYFN